jgi:DNA polymerase-1
MSANNGTAPPVFHSAQEAARTYLSLGLAVLDIPFRSKRPEKNRTGWQVERASLGDLDKRFPPDEPRTVAVFNGAASNNLADADLDCPEAVVAASILLPRTAWVFGRESAPGSHRLYRTDQPFDADTRQYHDVDGGVIMELRGSGGYSVWPGSTHRDGEPIVWEKFDAQAGPHKIHLSDLEQRMGHLAAATVLALHWPAPKSRARHRFALAIAGGLARASVPEDVAARIIHAAALAAQDEEARSRAADVRSTYQKHADGQPTTGWKTATDILGAEAHKVLDLVSRYLGIEKADPWPRPTSGNQHADIEDLLLPPPRPVLAPAALHGLAGDFIRLVEPQTEADPAGILVQFLAAFGNAIGRGPYFQIEGDQHRPNLFVATVGDTSTARKGTAWGRVRQVMHLVDPDWVERHVKGGLHSGEGLIFHVRDRRITVEEDGTEKVVDQGADVRNVLILETELASVLRRMAKSGNTLSAIIRQAWDGHTLASLTKHSPDRATDALVSIVGHITEEELADCLAQAELFNGFGNRFLWCSVRRSKVLPFGGRTIDLQPLVSRLREVLGYAQLIGCMSWATGAMDLWATVYPALTAGRSGLLGAVTARAPSQILRLAMLYALLDKGEQVEEVHLRAALAVWGYCEQSAARIFGGAQAGDGLAEDLFGRIEAAGDEGLSRTQIRDLYGRHQDAKKLLRALALLRDQERIEAFVRKTGGRDAEVWRAVKAGQTSEEKGGECDRSDRSDRSPEPQDFRGSDAELRSQSPATEGATEGGAVQDEKQGEEARQGLRSHFGRTFGRREGHDEIPENQANGSSVASVASVAPCTSETAEYRLITDAKEVAVVLTALDETEVVALDLETTGLNPRTDRVRLLSIAVDTISGAKFAYLIDCFAVDPGPVLEALADKTLLAHNALFDLGFLATLGFALRGRVHCTMLLERLLTASKCGFGDCDLQAVLEKYLGVRVDKQEQRSDWSGSLRPEQLTYAAEDVLYLHPLFLKMSEQIVAQGLGQVAEIESRALPGVVWTSSAGVAVDRQALERLAEGFSADEDRLRAELDALAPPKPPRKVNKPRKGEQAGLLFPAEPDPAPEPESWNWNSPQQVKAALALVGVQTDSTDDNALAKIQHPLAQKLRAYRAAAKMAANYGRTMLERIAADGRMYADWKQLGCTSGRMSCGSPNLQNCPKDEAYRRCFIAPPGRVLIKADYSQIEVRIVAKLCGDPGLVEAYVNGEDLHALTARRVLGVEKPTAEERKIGKTLNLALLYGMSARGLRIKLSAALGMEVTEQRAVELRQAHLAAYPRLKAWQERQRGKWGQPDEVITTTTLTGRTRLGVDRYTDKLNTPSQGTGADGFKQALALLWERREQCPGAVPVLLVHDELVVECAEDQAEAVAGWLKQAMLDGMAGLIEPVPVEVAVSIGQTWAGD